MGEQYIKEYRSVVREPCRRKTSGGICEGNLYPGARYAAAFSLYDQWKM